MVMVQTTGEPGQLSKGQQRLSVAASFAADGIVLVGESALPSALGFPPCSRAGSNARQMRWPD